jgi:hypothetical protein
MVRCSRRPRYIDGDSFWPFGGFVPTLQMGSGRTENAMNIKETRCYRFATQFGARPGMGCGRAGAMRQILQIFNTSWDRTERTKTPMTAIRSGRFA